MRLFIISERGAVERRRRLRAQLADVDIEWRFFESIDIRRERSRYFHHCDQERFLLHTGRSPTTAELGRFASHLMLWRSCRLLHEPLVILEDDTQPVDGFAAALSFVQRHIEHAGYLRLLGDGLTITDPPGAGRRWHIDRLASCPRGALAYAIAPRAADAFICRSEIFRAPVDLFIGRYWVHGQTLHALSPAVVGRAAAARRPLEPPRRRQERLSGIAWRRCLLKLRDRLRRAVYDLRAPAERLVDKGVRDVAAVSVRSDS